VKLSRRKQVFRKPILPPTSGKGSLHNHSHEKCSTRKAAFFGTCSTSQPTQDQTKTQAYRLSSITFCNNPSSFLKQYTHHSRQNKRKQKRFLQDQTSRFRRLSILCCSISSAFEQKVILRSSSVERRLSCTLARRTIHSVSC
jgi:hypothetical protein